MNIDDIKKEITRLAKAHDALEEETLDDVKYAELMEMEAEDLLVEYCEKRGYQVNGFPMEASKILDEELDDDYFSRERFRLYLDTLATQKEDVAEIWWFCNRSFWPDVIGSKTEFIEVLKHQLRSGFYDVEL